MKRNQRSLTTTSLFQIHVFFCFFDVMLVCFRAVNGLFHLLYMTLKDRFSLTVHTYCLLYHFLEWYSKANHSIFKWATRSTSRVRIIKTLQNSRLFQNRIAYRLVLVPNELSPFLVSMLIRPSSDFLNSTCSVGSEEDCVIIKDVGT